MGIDDEIARMGAVVETNEDGVSIFYAFTRGSRAVTLTVLRVGDEFIACDLTTHQPSAHPGSDFCLTLEFPGVCLSASTSFARGLYAALQPEGNKRHRVESNEVIAALAEHWEVEFGRDEHPREEEP